MIQLHTVIKRNDEHFLTSKLGNDLVMMNTLTGDYLGLNEVSNDIWELVKQPSTAGDIINSLQQQYEVDRDVCEKQTMECLHTMMEQGVISPV